MTMGPYPDGCSWCRRRCQQSRRLDRFPRKNTWWWWYIRLVPVTMVVGGNLEWFWLGNDLCPINVLSFRWVVTPHKMAAALTRTICRWYLVSKYIYGGEATRCTTVFSEGKQRTWNDMWECWAYHCWLVGSVISYESQFSVERRLKQNDVSIAGVLWVNVWTPPGWSSLELSAGRTYWYAGARVFMCKCAGSAGVQ